MGKLRIDEEFLSKVKMNSPSIKSLDLRDQGLTDDDVFRLCEALKGNTHITALDLSANNITDAGFLALCKVPHLKHLNVSLNSISLIQELNNNLKVLDISGNPIIDTSSKILSESSLAELHAAECGISDEGAQTLFRSHSIKILDLNNNSIVGSSLKSLAENTSIEQLDLSGNAITSDFLRFIAENICLKILNLTNNPLGDIGAKELSQNHSIQELLLLQCNIGDEGALALSLNKILKTLVLHGNNITDAGLKYFYENDTLLNLNLMFNSFSTTAAKILGTQYAQSAGNVFVRTEDFIKRLKKSEQALLPVDTNYLSFSPQKIARQDVDTNRGKRKAETLIESQFFADLSPAEKEVFVRTIHEYISKDIKRSAPAMRFSTPPNDGVQSFS